MKKEKSEDLNYILQKIKLHDKLYHQDDSPIITDYEYDQLCLKYDTLIKEFPNLGFPNRTNIGYKPKEQFSKVKHKKPMLSLNNGFSFEDINDFLNRIRKFLILKEQSLEVICEPKIDGLSISLSYEKGNFISAVTRGDGNIGELVTKNVLTITEIPKCIPNPPDFIEIRGEIFMLKKDFKELNKTQFQNNEKIFSNPRNAAAGSIRQKDPEVTNKRKHVHTLRVPDELPSGDGDSQAGWQSSCVGICETVWLSRSCRVTYIRAWWARPENLPCGNGCSARAARPFVRRCSCHPR